MKSEKHYSSVEGVSRDRLSELPDEVIVNILSFLPTLDAVRTVRLRRFGNLWTLVHSLYFSQEDMRAASPSLFLKFVSNVLILHRRPTINKFHLEIKKGIDEVEMWIRFALLRQAKALIVNITSHLPEYYRLPCFVFRSQSLVSLEINGCKIKNHHRRVHMESLRILSLSYVDVVAKRFEEIICGCPSLEEVVIGRTSRLNKLHITSPNIKRLKFRWVGNPIFDCPQLKMLEIRGSVAVNDVKLIGLSSVNEVKIHLDLDQSAYPCFSLLEKTGHAQVLEISDSTIQLLGTSLMKEPVFPHNRGKHFILKLWIRQDRILGISRLLRNSPCLEELTIYAYQKDDCFMIWEKILDPNVLVQELSCPCVMPQLKTVTMHGFEKSYQDQLTFVEFLLKSAINLDILRFVSYSNKQLTEEEELKFVKQLSSFQKASTSARVVFVT